MAEKLAREPPRVGVPIIDAKFGTEATNTHITGTGAPGYKLSSRESTAPTQHR